MTIPLHAAITAIATMQFTSDWRIIALSAFVGTWNDLIRIIFREGWNDSYLMLHRPSLYCRFNELGSGFKALLYALLVFVPPLGLHALIDRLVHKENGGWKWFTVYLELYYGYQ